MLDSSAATANALAPDAAPAGYGPADIQQAYALPGGTSITGPTVAIVDAYDDPTAAADLATYRSQYGLPACTVANGCFTKVGQTGTSSLPAKNASWAQEISLDLDMVSAACPTCKILLVETNSAAMANLGAGVNTAVRLGAVAVSNSYGGAESSSDTGYDTSYYNHPGVAITVSSGDSGYGAQYPAASRYVTAVGGTTLTRSSSAARGFTESVWSGAGSGCSAYDAKPSWQKDTGCSRRTIADVAAVADPNTGVAVYDSTAYNGSSGWMVFGGTSAASPIVASVYAKAGTPSSGSYPASFPYAHPGALNDVTSGSNGSSSPAYLATGGTGYDGPTGLGTPKGLTAFAG
jgi:subtilase family serine protease